ncbi:transaldolase [Candidatus Solirubrobacter pratensis]|uniref:transaldolase n=1 Tax=Candidatus Solirubrobacter pratensis TaxID=1298857 RepID=UPI000408E301|nr:transaldolase [Candidatus Solirubrobacter pratensis]
MDHRDDRPENLTLERPIDAAELQVKVFADGADLQGILDLYANPLIKGFTTNPTLMHKVGLRDYEAFARSFVEAVPDRPISFEVFSDEFAEMERQARKIAAWGEHVHVKVPVTNTRGDHCEEVLRHLVADGVRLNVTGMMTLRQVSWVAEAIGGGAPSYVSVFAGRIADTGRDPLPIMREALDVLAVHENLELIWASPRELLNVVQADQIGCHIITVTHDLLRKLPWLGRDLDEFSLDTVRMFHRDAAAAGFTL